MGKQSVLIYQHAVLHERVLVIPPVVLELPVSAAPGGNVLGPPRVWREKSFYKLFLLKKSLLNSLWLVQKVKLVRPNQRVLGGCKRSQGRSQGDVFFPGHEDFL